MTLQKRYPQISISAVGADQIAEDAPDVILEVLAIFVLLWDKVPISSIIRSTAPSIDGDVLVLYWSIVQ